MPDTSQPAATRQDRIVQATVAVLLEVGLRAANTRAVTEKAGVGTGLLNHYFRWPELRAFAWTQIFEAVAQGQFLSEADPQTSLEQYFATAFIPGADKFWHLWTEAAELSASDAAMKAAFGKAQTRLHQGLRDILAAGCRSGNWQLQNPQETAVRLGALYDGLAGLLLSGAGDMDAKKAETHLRTAFEMEAIGLRHSGSLMPEQ